jgi:opacity protein-like surface antigen
MPRIPVMGLVAAGLTVVAASSAAWSPVMAQPVADAKGAYLRIGAGVQWPESSLLKDQECSSTNPPALFGCGKGNDGDRLGADGAFRQSPQADLAVGYRWSPWLRTEALLNWSPQLTYQGQSNFLGPAGSNQPVSASGQALAGYAVVYVDAPPVVGVQPFVGAGFGAARTQLGDVTYRFPGIAGDASTIMQGGTSTSFAYLLTAGVSLPVSERIALELAYRWTDFGTVKTRTGTAQIVRPNRKTNLTIGGTEMDWTSQAVLASLRFRF